MDTLIQHDHCTPRTVQGSKNIIENFVLTLHPNNYVFIVFSFIIHECWICVHFMIHENHRSILWVNYMVHYLSKYTFIIKNFTFYQMIFFKQFIGISKFVSELLKRGHFFTNSTMLVFLIANFERSVHFFLGPCISRLKIKKGH